MAASAALPASTRVGSSSNLVVRGRRHAGRADEVSARPAARPTAALPGSGASSAAALPTSSASASAAPPAGASDSAFSFETSEDAAKAASASASASAASFSESLQLCNSELGYHPLA